MSPDPLRAGGVWGRDYRREVWLQYDRPQRGVTKYHCKCIMDHGDTCLHMPYMAMPRDRTAELITLTVLRLVISHARRLMSLGRVGCCIVTRPFSSPGGWGLGTRLYGLMCYSTTTWNHTSIIYISFLPPT